MRSFRRTALILTLILASLPLAGPLAAQRLHRYPVVNAGAHDARFRIWFETEGAVTLRLAIDPAFAGNTRAIAADAVANGVLAVDVDELLAATRYYYRVEDGSGNPVSPTFSFRTFPEQGADAPVSVLFGSCQQSHAADSGKTFTAAAGLGGDLFIQLGDWGYPDDLIPGYPTAPGSIEASYALRLDTTYPFARSILSQMPLAYIWDDHDFVGNNSHGAIDPALKSGLLAAYDRYIPHYPLPNKENGLWHSFMMGNVEFFMIDDRTQRSPADSAFKGNTFNPGPGHSMLAGFDISGQDQRAWLLDAIRSSKARWKVLVSPVFFNPATAPFINLALLAGRKDLAVEFADKWIGYPADVDSLRRLFQQGYGRNVLIICGDAHTNLYDDGTHSIVPEFMVGNLDKENSNLYGTLKSYGFDVWTAGQTDPASTVGRIRVETTPRHRLIVESFNEQGAKVFSYEMVDSATSSAPNDAASGWKLGGARIVGEKLEIAIENAPSAGGTVELYDMAGASILRRAVTLEGKGTIRIALPTAMPHGSYLGWVEIRGERKGFRVEG